MNMEGDRKARVSRSAVAEKTGSREGQWAKLGTENDDG